jgi:hypothetical protein
MIVNVKWTFAQNDTKKQPFEVPKEMVSPPEYVQGKDFGILSDFVVIDSSNSTPSIQIKRIGDDEKDITVISLNSMILDSYFNYIETEVHTAAGSKGILGLFERTGSELFLEDGVYSLWSFDTANPVETKQSPGQ